jgi:hypothetical protein
VVSQVAVQLHARSIRRAGCMTRGPGPPCWACWESEKRAHLARLHDVWDPAPALQGRALERVGEDSARDGWGRM